MIQSSVGGSIRKDLIFYYTGFEQDFLHAPTFAEFESQPTSVVIPTALTQTQGPTIERATHRGGPREIQFTARLVAF